MTLKELRKTCGLTQKEAADITKTSLRSFVSYENDEDSADQLKLQRIKTGMSAVKNMFQE